MEKKIINVADYLQNEEPQLVVLVKHWNVSEKLDIHFKGYWEFKYPEIDEDEVIAPETQADLADKFLSIDKNCIIETHSEYIVDRLVRRIVEDGLEGEALGLADMVQIYFVEKSKETKEVEFRPIEIDDKKGIIGWPDGFFDQSMNDKYEIMKTAATWLRKKRQET